MGTGGQRVEPVRKGKGAIFSFFSSEKSAPLQGRGGGGVGGGGVEVVSSKSVIVHREGRGEESSLPSKEKREKTLAKKKGAFES